MDLFHFYVNEWYRNRIKMDSLFYCQIHVTKRCQNNCLHCYFGELSSSITDFPLDQLRELLITIKRHANDLKLVPRVDFTGGDPLLYPSIEQAIEFCKELGLSYGFKCNPELLISPSSLIRKILYSSSGISLSLDGLQEMHDFFRCRGSFNSTIRAMVTCKNLGIRVRINTTVSNLNINNLIPLLDFLVNEKVIIDDYTWARYWSLDNPSLIINARQLQVVFSEMTDYISSLLSDKSFYYETTDGRKVPRIMFSFKEHQWYPFFVRQNLIDSDIQEYVNSHQNCINCTATKHYYIIDPDLSIYKCRKLPETKLNLANFGKENACNYHSNHVLECADCQYYNGCGGCSAITKCFIGEIYPSEPLCPYKTKRPQK